MYIGMCVGIIIALFFLFIRSIIIAIMPASFYYSFEQPIKINDKTVDCSENNTIVVKGNTRRQSKLNMTVLQQRDLVRLESGNIVRIEDRNEDQLYTVQNREENIQIDFSLECENLKQGTHKIIGGTIFEVKGVEKRYSWETEPFNINLTK